MINIDNILPEIPHSLNKKLVESYKKIGQHYIEHKWEPSELNGGKFCEAVYLLIEWKLNNIIPDKVHNLVDSCRQFENVVPDKNRVGDRSLRILIPRTLPSLYDIRNNRNVGHVCGDVDPNFMDASYVYNTASWIMAELVRIFHNISTEDAQCVVNSLIERRNPLIWDTGEIRKVLDVNISNTDQVLILLYSKQEGLLDDELFKSIEYSNISVFRKNILGKLHKSRLVDYNKTTKIIKISPSGILHVEKIILDKM